MESEDRPRRTRRWVRVLLWSIAGLAVVVTGLLIALWVTTPAVPELTRAEEPRELPEEWLDPQPDPILAEDEQRPAVEVPEDAFVPFTSRGTLALLGDDGPFGEEVYEISITPESAKLVSSGRFWFKILVARVVVGFEQSLTADSHLRPARYEMTFDGPLGFDQEMSATFAEDRALITRGDEEGEITLSPDRAFVVGTFSTYALVPRLFAEREQEGEATLDLLLFGGPPSQGGSDDEATVGLPMVRVTRAGTATIRAGETEVVAERYLVLSGLGANELLARGDEFLAFRAVDETGSLLVYRSDYFPDGIEFVDDEG